MEDKPTINPKNSNINNDKANNSNTANSEQEHLVQPDSATSSQSTSPSQPTIEKDDVVVMGTENNQPAVVVMKPPKKNKAGIIAAVVFIVLFLLASACLAVWYFTVYNSPENVALDAVRQFISAENIVTEGNIRIADVDTSDDHFVATLNFTSLSNHIPESVNVTLNFSERDSNDKVIDDHEIELDLGVAVMVDGVFYVQVSNLADAFDKIIYAEGADYSEYQVMIDLAEEIIELIDNEWWRISYAEVAEEIDSSYLTSASQFQRCLIDVINQDYSAEFIDIYNNNRFLNVEVSDDGAEIQGDSLYDVTIDSAKMADFLNRATESSATEDVLACYNNFKDSTEFNSDGNSPLAIADIPEFSAEDVNDIIPDDLVLTMSISDFSHRLHSVEAELMSDDVSISGKLNFSYTDNTATAPASYRSITELFDEIAEIINDYFEFPNDNLEEGIF